MESWKLSDHALTWYEAYATSLQMRTAPLISKWEDLKDLLKKQFYPMCSKEDWAIEWLFFVKDKDKVS